MSSLPKTYLWIFLLAASSLHNEAVTTSDLTTSNTGTNNSTNTTPGPALYNCSEQCLPAPDPTPAPPCPDTIRTDNSTDVSNSSALNCNGTIENCSISSNVTSCNGSLDNDCTFNRSVSSLCPNRTEEMADNTTCNRRTGECLYGCVQGYAKPFCDQLCPQNCTSCTYNQDTNRMLCEFCIGNNYLVDGTCTPCPGSCVVNDTSPVSCFMINGTCRFGCPQLYHGPQCNLRCGGICDQDICHQFTGECSYGCKRSAYCNHCMTECGLGCVRRMCNTDCSCKEGCKVNFYGSGCSVTCPNNCVSNPNNEETKCNSTDGACLFGCDKNKTWGNKCDKSCPSNCVAGECLSKDGNCSQGCDGNWYGAHCLFPCNPNCVNVSCLETDGTCIEGCEPGWHGAQCDRECNTNCFGGICDMYTGECFDGCKVGWYGPTCERNCSKTCARDVCDFEFGNCTYGCDVGFDGQNCETQIPIIVLPEEDYLYVNIGIGIGSGLIVILTLAIVCGKRKRRQKIFRKARAGLNRVTKIFSGFFPDYTELDLSRFDYHNAYGMLELTDNTNTRIAASDILCVVIDMSPDRIRQEFSRLSNEITRECIVAKRPENLSKNCFEDIFSYDENRVVLHAMDGLEPQAHDSDYINASYIQGLKKERHYIAAQGPTKGNVGDFWRMVWQEECLIIVMLNHSTNTNNECLLSDDIKVTNVGNLYIQCIGRQHFADFTLNEFELSFFGDKRLVRHLQFTRWPERGVPLSAIDLIEFHQKYRAIQTEYNATGPVIVYCQSGSGSTGVFIALDIAVEDIMETGECDVFETVQLLREQRVQMVKTLPQYQFLYEAVAHKVAFGCTLTSKTELNKLFDHLQIVHSSGKSKLQQSYEDCNATVLLARNATASNKTQHHYDYIDIYDNPELKKEIIVEVVHRNEHIFIDSYFRQDAIVATPMPSADTIADFCLLVIKKRVGIIVMLNAFDKKDKNVLQYWIGGMVYGNIKVSSKVVQKSRIYVLRNVFFEERTKHKNDRPSWTHSVLLIQYNDWDFPKSLVPEVDSFLNLTDLVRRQMTQTHDMLLLVHCMNGSAQCALFCVIHNLIEKVDHEVFVNVASTVSKVKARLPSGLETIEQYKFCYIAVNAYLSHGVLVTKQLTPKKDMLKIAASGDRHCVGDHPTPTIGRWGCPSDKDAEENIKGLYENCNN